MFDKYLPLAKPAIHLRWVSTSKFTKVGGMPCLPPELEWPEVDGKALPFLLQVDLGEVHAVLPSFLPSLGALYFFFDDKRYGGGYLRDRKWWCVMYHAADPKGLEESPRFAILDEEQVYEPRSLVASRIESLPSHYRFPEDFEAEGELHAYTELSLRPFGDSIAHHQMLGHAGSLQEGHPEADCEAQSRGIERFDRRDPAAASILEASREWQLLCQIDTDEEAGWMWGDVGTIFFWIRESDAKCKAFEKTWMTFECL